MHRTGVISACLLLVWIFLAVAPVFAFQKELCTLCTQNHCPMKKEASPSCHHKVKKDLLKLDSCKCKHEEFVFSFDAILPDLDLQSHEVLELTPETLLYVNCPQLLSKDTPPPKALLS